MSNFDALINMIGYETFVNSFLEMSGSSLNPANVIFGYNQPFYNIPQEMPGGTIYLPGTSQDEEDIYAYENTTIAESYFREIISTLQTENNAINRIQPEIIQSIVNLWISDINGNLPTIEQIVDELFRTRCECTLNYEDNDIIELYKYFIINHGKIPNCQITEICIQFKYTHNRFPTTQEINNTYRRMMLFTISPETFHQEDKVEVGVDNLDKIEIYEMKKSEFKEDTDFGCSLCQEDINEGQQYIKLSPCGHFFHYKDKECLEDACIINWLQKNNKCPNCKCEININDN